MNEDLIIDAKDEENRRIWKNMQKGRYVPMCEHPAYKELHEQFCNITQALCMLSDAEEKDPEDEGLRQTLDQFDAEEQRVLDQLDRLAKVLSDR